MFLFRKLLVILFIFFLLCACGRTPSSSAEEPKNDISWHGDIDWSAMEVIDNDEDLMRYHDACIEKRMTTITVLLDGEYYESFDGYHFPDFTCNCAYYVDFNTYNNHAALTITTTYSPATLILDAIKEGREDKLEGTLKEIYAAAKPIADKAMKIEDPLLREVFLFDAVCDRTSYRAPDPEYHDTWDDIRTLDDYESAEGPLLKGYANCQGYTDAFSLLAGMCGFEVRKVTGDGINQNEPHIWNLIRMPDGEWYMADLTWADEDVSIGRHARHYDLLNFGTDDEPGKNHPYNVLPSGISVPVSGNDEYRYYKYEDYGAGLRYHDEKSMLEDTCRRFHDGEDICFQTDYIPESIKQFKDTWEQYYHDTYGEWAHYNFGAYKDPQYFYMHMFHH